MIYLIYGTNKDKARAKANELVDSLRKKRPDASFFKMTAENWSEASLAEYISGQGLFEVKYIVLIDGLLELKEAKEAVAKAATLSEMKESPHVFIFREDDLDKATLTRFEKAAVKVQECSDVADSDARGGMMAGEGSRSFSKKKEFNSFLMADALGNRDRKGLWMLYRQAKKAGLEDEPIHGTLFWQVKSMTLARGAKTAGEAKLNPFVFSKAKAFAKNWNDAELASASERLVSLYHDSRRGLHDLDIAMERFVLSI